MQLQERKLSFFLLCSEKFAFQTLLPGFFTYHLHIGAAQNVKVALKFLSYLTLFHFYEASRFVLFFAGLLSSLDTNLIHSSNALAGILHQFHGVNWLL